VLTRLQKRGVSSLETIISVAHDRVIAVSPEEAKYTAHLGVPTRRITYIPNGIDAEKIRRIAGGHRSHRVGRRATIGFIARLVPQKKPLVFVKVLDLLRRSGIECNAIVVGDGPLRREMESLAEKRGIASSIEFVGFSRGLDHIGKLDILLHTSGYESMPYVILEAAAAGTAVVAARNSGSAAILGDNFPLIDDPDDVAGYVGAIALLLSQSDSFHRHIVALKAIADHFSIERMIDQTIAVYEQILRRGSASPVPVARPGGTAGQFGRSFTAAPVAAAAPESTGVHLGDSTGAPSS
jgi:glycosyltransferase involved in cell wall biosynthesis